jgi:hypothetical protein
MQKRAFPSAGGIFAGAVILITAVIAQPDAPAWISVKFVLISIGGLLLIANIVGLMLIRRQKERQETGSE